MTNSSTRNPLTPLPAAPRRCPICGKPTERRHQPFCSARCANIDLGRWLKGNYSIPTEDAPEDQQPDEEG